jgi:serine/threonine protein kinase
LGCWYVHSFFFYFFTLSFTASPHSADLPLPQAWDLLEPKCLFQIYDLDNLEINEAFHLAHMVRILGPPPLDFLRRSPKSQKYWDDAGDWKGVVPLPPPATLESLVTSLQGKRKDDFLNFIRGMLQWEPWKRTSTGHAWSHPWISRSEQASEATEK